MLILYHIDYQNKIDILDFSPLNFLNSDLSLIIRGNDDLSKNKTQCGDYSLNNLEKI